MKPASLELRPIDDAAYDGSYRLLSDGERFAVVRWVASPGVPACWAFPSGECLDFEPTEYKP